MKNKIKSLCIAVLVISDTRSLEEDTSGKILIEGIKKEGHTLTDYALVKDNISEIQNKVKEYFDNPKIQVVLSTGGTGLRSKDLTPEAIKPLLEKEIPGFGELFRFLSYQEIGTATIQSRTFAGLAKKTLIFALPGSTSACRDAWEKILKEQLDIETKPCNFASDLASRL